MESKTNYTIVGIAVVLLLFGFITAALWLSEGFDRKSYHDYVVYMEEAVTGLSEGSLVKYNGVKVGLVSSVTLSENPQLVKLMLEIEDGTPITVSTVANLIPQGITGTTILGLSVTSSDLTPLKAKPGEPYPVIPYKPSFLSTIEIAVNELSKNMKVFLSKENADNFKNILKNFQQVSNIVATNDQALNDTLRELPKLTAELRISVHEVAAASKEVSHTMTAGADVFNEILQLTLPPTVALLHQLSGVTGNFTELSAELQRNPTMLLWGSSPLKKGPGE